LSGIGQLLSQFLASERAKKKLKQITVAEKVFSLPLQPNNLGFRDVAQPGSALAWGARGRKFESCRPDEQEARSESCGFCFFVRLGKLALSGTRPPPISKIFSFIICKTKNIV
jgi:hypothetical protein